MPMIPLLDIRGPVATLTLRRPQLANRLAPADLEVLRDLIEQVNHTPELLVLQLRGQGRHFCSGFDIGEVKSSQTPGSGFGDMVDALENCRAVTIAAIHGGIYGGATDMALACDFRLGTERAEMFMPAAALGLHYYQSGLERYVSRLGLDIAKRLFLTADKLDAAAMRACGFLTELVAADALEAELARLSQRLCSMAPLPLLGMKKHLNQIARQQVDASSLQAAVQATLASQDLTEGALAWKQKRPARFQGR